MKGEIKREDFKGSSADLGDVYAYTKNVSESKDEYSFEIDESEMYCSKCGHCSKSFEEAYQHFINEHKEDHISILKSRKYTTERREGNKVYKKEPVLDESEYESFRDRHVYDISPFNPEVASVFFDRNLKVKEMELTEDLHIDVTPSVEKKDLEKVEHLFNKLIRCKFGDFHKLIEKLENNKSSGQELDEQRYSQNVGIQKLTDAINMLLDGNYKDINVDAVIIRKNKKGNFAVSYTKGNGKSKKMSFIDDGEEEEEKSDEKDSDKKEEDYFTI